MYAAHWLFICSFVWMTGFWLSEPGTVQQGTSGVFTTQTGLVTFSSDAPLENISAESNRLKGVVDTLRSTFAFSVEITSFTGFNSELQREHFNENYLESDKYPKAVFSGRIIEPIPYSTPGTYTVRAKGQLEIHGIKKERIIPCKVTVKPGSIKVISSFLINTGDHGIKIPRIVYDKISPDIQVTVEADLKPLP